MILTPRCFRRPRCRAAAWGLALALGGLLAACDHGLEPLETPPLGAIRGHITYLQDPTAWPPDSVLNDLRFFALPFVPRDTLDFFRDLNQLVFSDPLRRRVREDTFFVSDVEAQVYVYSGVAQQFSEDLLDWRPVGLFADQGGLFVVRAGEVTTLEITVDFANRPPFPPTPAQP